MLIEKLKLLWSRAFWTTFKRALGIVLGAVIVASSINSLIISNQIADGGVTGIAIILHYLFNWPISMIVLVLNIPLFIIGWRMVGRTFLLYSILGVGVFSLALDLTGAIPALTHDSLLASIFAGVLSGIGMGMIFRSRGSLGGTDILAVFFSRMTPFSVGQILLGIDAVIFLLTAILLRPEMAMYAVIYMFIATKVIDLVQEGMSHFKSVMVITSQPQEIAQDIMAKLERGVTFFNASGAFSGEAKLVVYCVISRTQLSQIKEIIHKRDSQAFLSISEVPEVVGEGFSSWRGH
ncbi:YitT family protein [Desulfitobacterium sp.]|uniref:YitT family protein n=1 Tax=Desulfitobacterium sp. TaxID=49981 RepID=UPI002B948353|nr:YitT family protein [Desulfitobacterium sp.]HVJ50350.1 YitT family protein [Desulfitobacterium sp.]